MRIISGTLGGRQLRGPRALELRPTSDRLKQTLFDIIGARVAGCSFLDVFAGTGSVGLEALSRGALAVVYIESAPAAVRLIRQNLQLCGISSGARIVREDVFTALRSLAREGYHPDFAFFDPPYDWRPYDDLLDILFRRGMVREAAQAIIEHHKKAAVPEQGDAFRKFRTVIQGDKCLSFYSVHSGGSGVS
jgi:16S rRNA (guanine(966)-N(2))-methyltransferase RsmD